MQSEVLNKESLDLHKESTDPAAGVPRLEASEHFILTKCLDLVPFKAIGQLYEATQWLQDLSDCMLYSSQAQMQKPFRLCKCLYVSSPSDYRTIL